MTAISMSVWCCVEYSSSVEASTVATRLGTTYGCQIVRLGPDWGSKIILLGDWRSIPTRACRIHWQALHRLAAGKSHQRPQEDFAVRYILVAWLLQAHQCKQVTCIGVASSWIGYLRMCSAPMVRANGKSALGRSRWIVEAASRVLRPGATGVVGAVDTNERAQNCYGRSTTHSQNDSFVPDTIATP